MTTLAAPRRPDVHSAALLHAALAGPMFPILAEADVQTGAMIALVPTVADAARLAVDGGEMADDLHLTLWYLGEAADYDASTRTGLVNAIRSMVERRNLLPVQARVFGVNLWNPDSDSPAWVYAVGDLPEGERPDGQETLGVFRTEMDEAWHDGGLAIDLPAQHSPWVPHICAEYSDEPDLVDELADRLGPVTFDRVRVAFAGEHTDIPLTAAAAPSALPGEPALGPTNLTGPVNRTYHRDHRGRFAKKPVVPDPDPDQVLKPEPPKKPDKTVGDAILPTTGRDFFGDPKYETRHLDPDAVAAVQEAMTIEYDGLATRNIEVGPLFDRGRPTTIASGEIVDSAGVTVGEFVREFSEDDNGTITVKHSLLKIDIARQGQGFAQAFNNQLYAWYRDSGVSRVTLLANIDVGGYAWARAGYDWVDHYSARNVRSRLTDVIRDGDDRIPADRRDQQRKLAIDLADRMTDYKVGDEEFPLPYDVADLGRWPGAGRDDWWIGKAVMMGASWTAVKAL